ncbi:MAG: DUF2812 domain-containing protein [Peptococcaceae bacterium]|nr:DUF2812 domain-containing protein [Peptococcaceae bacterium]
MKYTFRLVPCSIYENEIMESWLEELAMQGLVLENISFGIAKFRKEMPQRIRYCMSIIPAERWDVYEWIPGRSSFIDLCKASGWNYICQRGQFGIFMTADESVVEMHTEPELQYLDYKNYVDWRALIGRLMILMVALYVFWGAFLRYEFLTIWAQEEHLLVISVLMVLLTIIIIDIRQLVCPILLYQKLKRDGITHERKEWKRYALCYRLLFISVACIFVFGFGYMFYSLIQ